MLANFTGNFKGLPQEIVDEILEYLEDHRHRQTLVACSLTCKALFLSARHIIHRQLYVDDLGRVDTSDDQQIYRYMVPDPSPSCTLSAAANCDLVQYTRKLTFKAERRFTPQNLRPYLPQFQMFPLLTSITLHKFDPSLFIPVFEQYFGHLKLQMRSLGFVDPLGSKDDLMYFICQFPNLEDLEFNPFPSYGPPKYDISTIQNSPTLGGTLRVLSTDYWRASSFEPLTQLPSGLRFRSIEFLLQDRWDIDPSIVIRECTSTLRSLTYISLTRESPP